MDWRMIMRRCPGRSMTIVGDFAQAGSAAAPRDWSDALDRYATRNWRVRTLSVNYRTPRTVMGLADRVLAEIRPDLTPPRSVRDEGAPPWFHRVSRADLARAVRDAVTAECSAVDDGQVAVIAPSALVEELPGAMTVVAAKGLEFDSVIVVEPAEIWTDSPRGGNDLYVALTRSTRRLGIIHSGPLPAAIRPAARRASADHAHPRPD